MGFVLGSGAALPGRIVVGVAEVLGIGQFQDEANAAVVHGEDDGGQIALGGIGESISAVLSRVSSISLRVRMALTVVLRA